ncbi:MAG: GNAT family N-acetyltransferase [Anaerolineae bacterium]
MGANVTIASVTREPGPAVIEGLVDVLQDSVNSGASVGFMPPLSADEARAYWTKALEQVAAGERLLLVARRDDRIVGTVALGLETRPNGSHRAEVQKLLVHSAYRRQGIAAALMAAVEDAARADGRKLLVLDTREGDAAEMLYERIGYTRLGSIPGYARNADGSFDPTVIFYRPL